MGPFNPEALVQHPHRPRCRGRVLGMCEGPRRSAARRQGLPVWGPDLGFGTNPGEGAAPGPVRAEGVSRARAETVKGRGAVAGPNNLKVVAGG